MGYFTAGATAVAAGPRPVRQRVVMTSEHMTEQRIAIGPGSPVPEDVTLTIRNIGMQWPDRDFHMAVEDGTVFAAWNEPGDLMSDVIAVGDDVLIEFLLT